MSNEGCNRGRSWVCDIPDIDIVPNTTSHRFAIRGELAVVKVLTRTLKFSNNNSRTRVSNCNN